MSPYINHIEKASYSYSSFIVTISLMCTQYLSFYYQTFIQLIDVIDFVDLFVKFVSCCMITYFYLCD